MLFIKQSIYIYTCIRIGYSKEILHYMHVYTCTRTTTSKYSISMTKYTTISESKHHINLRISTCIYTDLASVATSPSFIATSFCRSDCCWDGSLDSAYSISSLSSNISIYIEYIGARGVYMRGVYIIVEYISMREEVYTVFVQADTQ